MNRSPFRRRIDTVDRLDFLRFQTEFRGYASRLPRMTILCYGLEVLEPECQEATSTEVRNTLRDMFSDFAPTTTHA